MRRSIFILALCSLFLAPLMAQEAFYIYRNDGDFNGFFYDEVVEMRYSKIALDSTEYEQYVTCEIVLADTLYRIPLASIDSIGFQQPEIKLNPRVKLIEKDGYSPYLDQIIVYSYDTVWCFKNLPASMRPQVGDVLLGLPTDEIAETKYAKLGGSCGCVVESSSMMDANTWIVKGRPIDQLSDVFEQYITVEEVGVTDDNQIVRRVAGCSSDGWPRRVTKKEGNGEVTIIDFNSTLSYDLGILKDTVKLSAGINMKLRVRAAYKITWTHLYVKLTEDLLLKVKPALTLSSSRDYDKSLADIIPLPKGVPFPAACPIFELCPLPTLFLKISGSVEAQLNLPQVGFGLGQDIIIDSHNLLFPISCTLHLVEDEEKEPSEEMLDLSGEVRVQASMHLGVEFQMSINTASWIKKVFEAGIGLHFYAGPKLAGNLTYRYNFLTDNIYNAYNLLSPAEISLTKLALAFEAGAKAQIGWNDPEETTFLSADKELFKETWRLVPTFEKAEAELAGDYVVATLYPHPETVLMYKTFSIGVFGNMSSLDTVGTYGEWAMTSFDKKKEENENDWIECSYTIPLDEFRNRIPGIYYVKPILFAKDGSSIVANSVGATFNLPMYVEWEGDSIFHFPASGGDTSLIFTTNCPKEKVLFHGNNWVKFKSLELLDSIDGFKYKLTCTASPVREFFHNRNRAAEDPSCPYILPNIMNVGQKFYVGVEQAPHDLNNLSLSCNGRFTAEGFSSYTIAQFKGNVSAARTDANTIEIVGDSLSPNGEEYYSLIMTLTDTTASTSSADDLATAMTMGYSYYRAEGQLESIKTTSNESTKITIEFNNAGGTCVLGWWDNNSKESSLRGPESVTYGRYYKITTKSDGSIEEDERFMQESNPGSFSATIKIPCPTVSSTPTTTTTP